MHTPVPFAEMPFPWALVPAWVTIGLGLLVARQRRAHRPDTDPPDLPEEPPLPPRGVDAWARPAKADKRRCTARRSGHPVEVEVVGPDDGGRRGYVMDRSRTGLRVAVRAAIPEKSRLKVRACEAPPGSPWVEVRVRWCRQVGGRWELGCEFTTEQPWGVLLTFG